MASDLLQGYLSLSKDINKATAKDGPETAEGAIGALTPELELGMDDEELLTLAKDWKAQWEPYAKELAKSQDDNEKYWLILRYLRPLPGCRSTREMKTDKLRNPDFWVLRFLSRF